MKIFARNAAVLCWLCTLVVAGGACSSNGDDANSEGRKPQLEIVSYGFTQAPPDPTGGSYLTYAVVLRNTAPDAMLESSKLDIAFYDAANTVVRSESGLLSFILPGQTVAIGEGLVGASGVTRMEVEARRGSARVVDEPAGSITAESINTEVQDVGGLRTTCTLESTFPKKLEGLKVTAVYFDAADEVIGGASIYGGSVPANGRAPQEITASTNVALPARTEIYASVSNLTALGLSG